MASSPSIAIARPLNVLMPRMTVGVMRPRSDDAVTVSRHHQAADPSSTPPTSAAGLTKPAPAPNPNVAASAANEMIVAGFVIVSPNVETYAHAKPVPVGGATSLGVVRLS